MRPGGERSPEIQTGIRRLLGRVLRRDRIVVGSRGRSQRKYLESLSIDAHLDLMRLSETLNQLVAIARQTQLELIVAIGREDMAHVRAGARAERLAVEVIFLSEIRREG